METLRTLRHAAEARLRAVGVDTPELDARLLLQHALGLTREQLLFDAEALLTPQQAAAVHALIERRAAREPVSRILGERAFWSVELSLNADTLDPRPDTETVVEAVLDAIPDRSAPLRILDLGTGTGCIALALLAELPNATGLGVDVSPGAVDAAIDNARRNGLESRARFQTGNWGDGITERFDLVLSNPPYIPSGDIPSLDPEVRAHDPQRALDGGADGLDAYRIITAQLPRLLKPQAIMALEVGAGQAAAVAALLEAQGVCVTGVFRDLGGIERCVRGYLS